ncbi:MAG: hypothetical protein K9L17_05590 [Clostridiales bacterium]|nr:hypothetical protein [Clostridiales bacterium]MCF8022144.1 hypothetical protein [Clostridiales bacterium]
MEWAQPDKLYAIFRCTNAKHADDLVNKGTIMFNNARAWADIEKKKGKGQGDLYEGVFAACHPSDVDSVTFYNKKYNDVECVSNGKLLYFRRKSVMQMPAFCFFLLKQSLFDCSGKEGKHTLSTYIPGTFFQEFADGLSADEEKQPSLVLIHDMEEFVKMIKRKLISMGVNESDVLVRCVQYLNKHIPFYNSAGSPEELFLKDKSFSYQAEGRILVNTTNKLLIDKLVRNPINIGPIKEFSEQSNTDCDQGIFVKMTADVHAVD